MIFCCSKKNIQDRMYIHDSQVPITVVKYLLYRIFPSHCYSISYSQIRMNIVWHFQTRSDNIDTLFYKKKQNCKQVHVNTTYFLTSLLENIVCFLKTFSRWTQKEYCVSNTNRICFSKKHCHMKKKKKIRAETDLCYSKFRWVNYCPRRS